MGISQPGWIDDDFVSFIDVTVNAIFFEHSPLITRSRAGDSSDCLNLLWTQMRHLKIVHMEGPPDSTGTDGLIRPDVIRIGRLELFHSRVFWWGSVKGSDSCCMRLTEAVRCWVCSAGGLCDTRARAHVAGIAIVYFLVIKI